MKDDHYSQYMFNDYKMKFDEFVPSQRNELVKCMIQAIESLESEVKELREKLGEMQK